MKRLMYLSVVMFGTAFASGAQAWQVYDFETYCGQPATNSNTLVIGGEVILGSSLGTEKLAFYKDATTANDKDAPTFAGRDCVPQHRAEYVSKSAKRILGSLSAMKYKGRGFDSPSPYRLGPRISVVDANGKPVVGKQGKPEQRVRLYINSTLDGYGSALTPCNDSPTPAVKDRISFVQLKTEGVKSLATPVVYYVVAHELMHVIQNAQKIRMGRFTDNCRDTASWITEGTASAVGWALTHKRYREPSLKLQSAYHYYGLRYYNLPLGKTFDSVNNPGYRSASLWRFLVERYAGGNYGLVAHFLENADFNTGRDDWIDWLDQSLRIDPSVNKPLYLVYPEFLTEFAGWGGRRFRKVKQSKWLSDGFAGCYKVTLDPSGQTTKTVNLPIFVHSGQCLLIDVNLNPAAHAWATLKFNASSSDKRLLDSLHLGESYAGGGAPRDCYKDASAGGQSVSCLLKPDLAKLPAAASADGAARHVRTWKGQRLVADGKEIKNLYVLTYMPVEPSDKDLQDGGLLRKKLDINIGLDVARVKTPGQASGSAAAADAGGVANDQGGYPLGGELPGADGNMDFGKMLFAQGGGPNLMKMMQKQGGSLRSFSFETGRLDSGDGEPQLLPDLNLLVLLANEQGLKFGQTGEFPASVSGGLGAGADQAIVPAPGYDPPVTVTVHEFSDRQLHISAQGNYCRLTALDLASKRCRNPQTFFAEMRKPFGWMYDPEVELTAIASPGMALYQEHTVARLKASGLPGLGNILQNLPQFDPRNLPAPQPAPEPQTGGTGPQCSCSCEEYQRVMGATQDYSKRLEAMFSGGSAISEADGAAMAADSQCMDQCGLRYHEAGCLQ